MSCYGLLTYYAILLPLHLGCCYSVASIRDVIDWSSRVTVTYFPLFEFVGWSWSGEVGDGGRACWLCHHSRSNHIGVTSCCRSKTHVPIAVNWLDCAAYMSCMICWPIRLFCWLCILVAAISLLRSMTSLIGAVACWLRQDKSPSKENADILEENSIHLNQRPF